MAAKVHWVVSRKGEAQHVVVAKLWPQGKVCGSDEVPGPHQIFQKAYKVAKTRRF